MKPKIEVLVGMVASGKTTYARERAQDGALIVSHDDLTQMLHGAYRYEAELRGCYRAMMIQLASNAIVANRDVVVDRTHLTVESRKMWIDVARAADVPIFAVGFERLDSLVHALRRHSSDSRGRSLSDWQQVALHHAEQADVEPLRWADEGFTGVIYPV